MYNEDIKQKKIYEDYNFDHDDLKVLRDREKKSLDLIKSG